MPRTANQPTQPGASAWPPAARRLRPIRVLFVSDNPAALEQHLRELGDHYFAVSADAVSTDRDFHKRLRARPYDAVIAEETTRGWTGMRALECLRERDEDLPFILVATTDDETVAESMLKGASDCVDRSRLDFLPLAVALAVESRAAQDERNRVEQQLQRSRALYDALVDNPTYGVCQVDAHGRLVHANEALATMLRYGSRDALLQMHLLTDVTRNSSRAAVQEAVSGADHLDGLYVDWTCKDGTPLRIRLSGRQIHDGADALDGEWEFIAEDLTAQRALEDHLRHLAATDPLTGLANYRRLADAVDTEIKRAERTGREFAVLMFDLDGLKQINDQHGHLTGDRALRRVADTLLASCRSLDTVARYGGDEFAVVLPETSQEGAMVIARRIRERLGCQSEVPRLSASIGIALYPRDGETIEQLLLTADRALYRMKGRETRLPCSARNSHSM